MGRGRGGDQGDGADGGGDKLLNLLQHCSILS
jgi:hypothetical protein